MNSFVFGTTSQGLPIVAHKFGRSGPQILILGGVHGNETEGVVAGFGLLHQFMNSFPYELNLTLIPVFNVDGVLEKSRLNGRGVDLNRNLPTNDWNPAAFNAKYPPGPSPNSELENQALVKFLEANSPRLVISLHSWNPMLNINGRCKPEAELISKLTGYSIEESIGYPTPGCLGTYCGLERDMPTITYEIERGLDPKQVLSVHVPAILEALKISEKERR